MISGILQRRVSRSATRTKAKAAIKHAAKMTSPVPDTNRSKAAVATRGPTLSAAASEGSQNHHTNPSGINAQEQGTYQKLGVPKSNTRVKQVPPNVNNVPATIREMASGDAMIVMMALTILTVENRLALATRSMSAMAIIQ